MPTDARLARLFRWRRSWLCGTSLEAAGSPGMTTDHYVGIDAMHRNRPRAAERYRPAEIASDVELAGAASDWLFCIDSRLRNSIAASSSSRLATSSSDFICAAEIVRFWRRLAA